MAFRDEVQALADGYLAAYARQDAEGCAAGFSGDALMESPFGPPAAGRAAIAAAHRAWFEEPERNKRLDAVEAEAEDALGWARLRWSAEVDDPETGAPTTAAGSTLAVLRRGPEGWVFARMMLVPDA